MRAEALDSMMTLQLKIRGISVKGDAKKGGQESRERVKCKKSPAIHQLEKKESCDELCASVCACVCVNCDLLPLISVQ